MKKIALTGKDKASDIEKVDVTLSIDGKENVEHLAFMYGDKGKIMRVSCQ